MNISKTVLILGASGLLGQYFISEFLRSNYKVIACSHKHEIIRNHENLIKSKLNALNHDEVESMLKKYKPKIIIHCAGLTNVDRCEQEIDLAFTINSESVRYLARCSNLSNAQFVYISTDHLFPGLKSNYCETDEVIPLNVYGKSKHSGEMISFEENINSLVIRTNFFGKGLPWRQSFTDWIYTTLKKGHELKAFTDSYFSPIAIQTLVVLVHELLNRQATGIFNVCGSERLSKYDFALKFSRYFGLNEKLIVLSAMSATSLRAQRPNDMSLNVEKLSKYLNYKLPDIEQNFKVISKDYS